jgi:protein-S-isoprenylcysteine O-methyltransferase Ste14
MGDEKRHEDTPGVKVPPPVIFAAGFAAGWGLGRMWPVRVFAWGGFRMAGWLVAVAAGVLAAWGLWTMLRARTNINPHKPAVTLLTSGPFRWSRNPLYLSLVLLTTGAAVYWDMVWVLATLVPVVGVMGRFVIRREERHLEAKFGEAYREYMRRVRRWV